MMSNDLYQGIDLEKTGGRLEKLIKENGYSVKDIQRLLHLSCPQPVYRWIRGQRLPTVDHLFVLAKVLHVHMEDLLVSVQEITCSRTRKRKYPERNYVLAYIYYYQGGTYERLDCN